MIQKETNETLSYLLAQICKAHRNQVHERLTEIGLHAGQEMLLMALWQQDGLTQSELAGGLCVQPATVTRSIDRLTKNGLILRRPDANDRRVSRVYLTEEGRNLQTAVEEVWQAVEMQSFANLTLEEQLLLRRLLMQVYQNIS